MKAKRVFRLVSAVVLLAVLVIGTASGYKSEPNEAVFNHQGKRSVGCEKLMKLTEGQKEQIKILKLNLMKDMMPLNNEMDIKKATLKAASTRDNVNVKEVNKLIEEIGALRVEKSKKQFSHKQSVRNLLTDEQKIMFDSRSGHKQMRRHGNELECGRQREFSHKAHMRNKHEGRASAK